MRALTAAMKVGTVAQNKTCSCSLLFGPNMEEASLTKHKVTEG